MHKGPAEGSESEGGEPDDQQYSFEQSCDEEEKQLQELRKQVELTRSELIQLVDSDGYTEEAEELNKRAVELMREGHMLEGGVLLGEAEKVLEYAANRGKEINRNLIVTVLHNLACCHQQTWSLERCSNYVEALIYNLNCEMRQVEAETPQGQMLAEGLAVKRSLAQYYLLFCAINSQLKRNDAALIAAKKANSLLRNSSASLARLALKTRTAPEQPALRLLEELGRLRSSSEGLDVNSLLETAKQCMAIWKNRCSFPNLQLRTLIDRLKDYSIGNVMQMEALPMVGTEQDVWEELGYEKVLERVVVMSMSYFTMATELRLLAMRLGGKEQAKGLSEFRESQCYHLIAIILLLFYLPFDLLYLSHILTSFQNHYSIDLTLAPTSPSIHSNTNQLFSQLFQAPECDPKASTAHNTEAHPSSGGSRNSYEEARLSHLGKLQTYVRASLQSQQTGKVDLAKLNNYYYIRGEQMPAPKETSKNKQKDKKNLTTKQQKNGNLRRICVTSKQSAQKTPVAHSPAQLSPLRSRCSKSKDNLSSKQSSVGRVSRSKKMSHVMEEYFTIESTAVKVGAGKRKVMSPAPTQKKSKGSKENKEVISTFKLKPVQSPDHKWKAQNLTNRKEGSELKGVKSPAKPKSKLDSKPQVRLQGVKSKGKPKGGHLYY